APLPGERFVVGPCAGWELHAYCLLRRAGKERLPLARGRRTGAPGRAVGGGEGGAEGVEVGTGLPVVLLARTVVALLGIAQRAPFRGREGVAARVAAAR